MQSFGFVCLLNKQDKYLEYKKIPIFWGNSNGSMIVKFEEDTEANARAKMLIYLIENKLINPKEDGKG